jgi:HSP20 family protein
MPVDMIRLMKVFFAPAATSAGEPCWQPATDVYRTRTGWLVKFDLAGVRKEDIDLTAQGARLTVRGTRRDWCLEEACACYRMEIAYSHFERSVTLPVDLDRARITAEHRDGMLLVRIQPETEKP